VPEKARQFQYDPEVRSYYWNEYLKTTEQGQQSVQEAAEQYARIKAERAAKKATD
jgi:hypothetical protein